MAKTSPARREPTGSEESTGHARLARLRFVDRGDNDHTVRDNCHDYRNGGASWAVSFEHRLMSRNKQELSIALWNVATSVQRALGPRSSRMPPPPKKKRKRRRLKKKKIRRKKRKKEKKGTKTEEKEMGETDSRNT